MIARLAARTFGGLRRDQRGVTIVEMGLIAPVLALFIAGIIDLSQGLAQRFALQQAVNRSLELAIANPPQAEPDEDDVDLEYIVDEAAAAAGVPEGQVRIARWHQCNDRDVAYTATCNPGEDSARYLEVEIDKTFRGSFFVAQMTMTATGTLRIQ